MPARADDVQFLKSPWIFRSEKSAHYRMAPGQDDFIYTAIVGGAVSKPVSLPSGHRRRWAGLSPLVQAGEASFAKRARGAGR